MDYGRDRMNEESIIRHEFRVVGSVLIHLSGKGLPRGDDPKIVPEMVALLQGPGDVASW